jgi:hypothetical protein
MLELGQLPGLHLIGDGPIRAAERTLDPSPGRPVLTDETPLSGVDVFIEGHACCVGALGNNNHMVYCSVLRGDDACRLVKGGAKGKERDQPERDNNQNHAANRNHKGSATA